MDKHYYPDLRVMGEVIVELKASQALHPIDDAQTINAIKCAHHEVGLLINFGELSLNWKRFVV